MFAFLESASNSIFFIPLDIGQEGLKKKENFDLGIYLQTQKNAFTLYEKNQT
jgi:hypothetical protein